MATPRAVYTDDEGLRVFQAAGVADELHADMNVDSAVQWVRADGDVMIQFLPKERRLGCPGSEFLYQPYLDNKLEALLARYPHVEVPAGPGGRRLQLVPSGRLDGACGPTGTSYGGCASVVDDATRETARAQYLVGADGGCSLVRLKLGIEMVGKSPQPARQRSHGGL